MADTDPKAQSQMSEEEKLKYLEFVQIAALHVVLCFSRLYEYAKANSGPLKPGVQSVEGTVKTVVGPVYDKFHDVPIELLKFVDRKVDESINKLGSHVPPVAKQVSTQAMSAAQKAPSVARAVASEFQRAGIVDTASELARTVYSKCEPAAKEMYTKYEPMAEHYAVSAWQSLNRLPLIPQAVQVVAPTAAYCSEKYNEKVRGAAEKGNKVLAYLPLVPTEKIARALRPAQA